MGALPTKSYLLATHTDLCQYESRENRFFRNMHLTSFINIIYK